MFRSHRPWLRCPAGWPWGGRQKKKKKKNPEPDPKYHHFIFLFFVFLPFPFGQPAWLPVKAQKLWNSLGLTATYVQNVVIPWVSQPPDAILYRKTDNVTFCRRNHDAILCKRIDNIIVSKKKRNAILCREIYNVRPKPKDQRKDFLKQNE